MKGTGVTSAQAQGWCRASARPGLPKAYVRFIAIWEALCAWFRDVQDIASDPEMKKSLSENLQDWHAQGLSSPEYRSLVSRLTNLSPIYAMKGAQHQYEVSITGKRRCPQDKSEQIPQRRIRRSITLR
jgi:hypothetical protein